MKALAVCGPFKTALRSLVGYFLYEGQWGTELKAKLGGNKTQIEIRVADVIYMYMGMYKDEKKIERKKKRKWK